MIDVKGSGSDRGESHWTTTSDNEGIKKREGNHLASREYVMITNDRVFGKCFRWSYSASER